jgi:hypothetical protein
MQPAFSAALQPVSRKGTEKIREKRTPEKILELL